MRGRIFATEYAYLQIAQNHLIDHNSSSETNSKVFITNLRYVEHTNHSQIDTIL